MMRCQLNPYSPRTRNTHSEMVKAASHAAKAMPPPAAKLSRSPPLPTHVAISTITDTPAATFNRCSAPDRSARFQANNGPMPATIISGVISGTNTALKYGAPTDSFPNPSASAISG